MTNTKADLEILKISSNNISNKVLIIKEQPVKGGGINQEKTETTIYDSNIIYEF